MTMFGEEDSVTAADKVRHHVRDHTKKQAFRINVGLSQRQSWRHIP
jgi:hypothetical protein